MSKKQKVAVKGKQVLLLGLVALVITAGYYRWNIEAEKLESVPVTADGIMVNGENTEEENEQAPQTEDKNMATLREERDKSRGEAVEEWKKIVQDSESSQQMKKEAEEKIKLANQWAEQESAIENLVKAKGFPDCFAHINQNGVSVTVAGGEINGAKVAQIKDIILSQADVEVRDIKISAQTY